MERRNSAPADSSINNKDCNSNGKIEGSEYIPARCRITKPNPPKPAKNPLQFVKVGPCDLYRSAQEQLKKVQVIKKMKEEYKDDSADWQSNLDNWKSSRRKRQEHIIERVVEIKNMEEQEKARRRSKTFSEMLEDRNSRRRKLSNLAVYAESDGNDLSELGISTSSSRKGSISGDSTVDDGNSTRDSDEANSMSERNNSTEPNGYQLDNEKSDTANNQTGSNEEYTYESAIQGYKSRVNRNYRDQIEQNSVTSSGSKNEPRKISYFTFQSLSESSNELNYNNNANTSKVDVPKVDISERKHIFESGKTLGDLNENRNLANLSDELSQSKSIKERLKHLEKCTEESLKIKKATKLLSGDIMTVRDRLSSLVSHASDDRNNNMPSWSSTSQLNSTNESNESPTSLDEKEQNDCDIISLSHIDKSRVFHCSLDSLDVRDVQQSSCMLQHVQSLDGLDFCERNNYPPSGSSTELLALSQCGDTDREDSGIQTADVSCSVSQADDPDDDSDTMAAIHTACIDQHFTNTDTSVKSYASELPSSPVSSEQVDSNNFSANKSDSSVIEELITCTINMDLCNKIKFNDKFQDNMSPIGLEGIVPITDPLAPPKSMDPPKEKPPPPPVDAMSDDDENSNDLDSSSSELKRLNSTKRIKNEIRNKRSSFLGIEGLSDNFEINLTKPRDATTILQEELQLEKQLYRQSQSYQYSLDMNTSHMDVESRDSGVELEPRSISEPDHDLNCIKTNISLQDEDEISKKEREIIENLEKEEQWRHHYNSNRENSYNLSQDICQSNENLLSEENQSYGNEYRFIDQDVLRVKRELLEIEQEDLERQREDLYQNRKVNNTESVPMADQTVGLPNVYAKNKTENLYANFPNYYQNSNLNGSAPVKSNPTSSSYSEMQLPGSITAKETPITANPMSRHTLHALSAAPRSKLMTTDSWIQSQSTKKTPTLTSTQDRQNYNQHWLIQEAEQRRLSEPPRPTRGHFSHRTPDKQIPRAVVQNLTQRLQNRPTTATASTRLLNRKDMPVARSAPLPLVSSSYGPLPSAYERGRSLPNSTLSSHGPPPPPPPVVAPPNTLYDLHDKMLSVSGKKKCSHCGDELGRGAAMIIESLCLFYHMDCFKCCVCHVQLGDGLMGTDVRVRNHKLHCHNCYSSDDGVKFSCV